jgi:hypothetical protein
LLGRIERLDAGLGASTASALSYLPVGMGLSTVRQHRKSA